MKKNSLKYYEDLLKRASEAGKEKNTEKPKIISYENENGKLDEFDTDTQDLLFGFIKSEDDSNVNTTSNIENLKESILGNGQIEPIILSEWGTIINGNRRYTAIKDAK